MLPVVRSPAGLLDYTLINYRVQPSTRVCLCRALCVRCLRAAVTGRDPIIACSNADPPRMEGPSYD